MSSTHIVYNGPSNFQVFNKGDFEKAGLEQGKLTFERGVPQEVPSDVADALTNKDNEIFGDFDFSTAEDMGLDDEEADEETKAAKKKAAAKKSAAKKAASSQTASGSQSAGSEGAGVPGGNGSSTGGEAGTGGTVGNGSSTAGAGA